MLTSIGVLAICHPQHDYSIIDYISYAVKNKTKQKNPMSLMIFQLFFLMLFIFERERERVYVSASRGGAERESVYASASRGGAERERGTEDEKWAPQCQHRARHGAQTQEL